MSERRASSWPLAAGAAIGVLLAAVGLVRPASGDSLGTDVVASVDGAPITRADLRRAMEAARADRRAGGVDSELERQVLDRLIEQQLLVGRALELGLAERDPQVRADLSQAMIDLLVARGEQADPPEDAELERFYQQNQARFRPPARIQLEWATVAIAKDAGAAVAAAQRLRDRWARGEHVRLPRPALPLPRGWLPASKLPDYLGASLARVALTLDVDEVSQPYSDAQGVHLLRVVAREAGELPPFDRVREQVAAAWGREAGERRLRDFLVERRKQVPVVVAEDLR